MNSADLAHYRRRLLALKRRLGGDMTALEQETLRRLGGEASGGLSDVPVHPADMGTDNFEEELSLSLLENQAETLAEIDQALERIESGTFGICENCHLPIPRSRLEALPYARYCVRCAQAASAKGA